IKQQVTCEVYVTAFLLDLHNFDHVGPGPRQANARAEFGRVDQSGKFLGDQKCPHVSGEFGNSRKSIQIQLLAPWRSRIDVSRYARSEVPDADDPIRRPQQALAERLEVEPLKVRAFL